MVVQQKDMSNQEMVRVFRTLEPHLPISDEYERVQPQKKGVWWSSQKEHMIGWFRSQRTKGSGSYSRNNPNTSARTTYNRLLCPAAFIWIAEALGEEPHVIQAAVDAALNEPNARKRPGLVRKYLPWERIYELASQS